MIFEQISGGNFSYLIGDATVKDAVVVDPGSNVAQILRAIQRHELQVRYILNTHSHRDHSGGNRELKANTGAQVAMHVSAPLSKDIALADGDVIRVGEIEIRVMHTPGHTPDSVCLLLDTILLTGDTLFVGECGRTDLPGGSARDMHRSLNRILELEDDFQVYPGHNYGPTPSSTIGHERKTNYTLAPRSLAEFIEFMSEA
jgi:glyoxylase-like metal-dependent hydrolase (beta-lactamase superfamily II)